MDLIGQQLGMEKIAPRFVASEPSRFASFGDISLVSGTRISDPLAKLGELAEPSIQEMLEAVIFWTQSKFGIQEFVDAQLAFQNSCGKVYHEDVFYHQRMSYFLDYFVFERKLSQLGGMDEFATPFAHFLRSEYFAKVVAVQSWAETFWGLENFKHSLFLVLKNTKKKLCLRDLFSNEKYEIIGHENLLFRGFDSGIVIQGFMFVTGGGFELSQGLILHPPRVYRIIKRNLKRQKKDPKFDKFAHLTKLAKQNLAFIRHKNLDARKVYLS